MAAARGKASGGEAPTTRKVVFVTAYFRRHGMAFFDMILRAFAKDPTLLKALMTPGHGPPPVVPQYPLLEHLSLDRLPFSRAVFLYPKALKDPEARWAATDGHPLQDGKLEESLRMESDSRGLVEWLRRTRESLRDDSPFTLARALEHWPRGADRHALWQVVHELPLADQVKWWREHSPWRRDERVELVPIGDAGLRPEDPKGWADAVDAWVRSQPQDTRFLVNLHGTATENQLAWYYLGWRSPRLRESVFCECSTPRGPRQQRFRPIQFTPLSKDLLRQLGQEAGPKGQLASPERTRASKWLEFYRSREDNFVILVLGERGTGKSSRVKEVFKRGQKSRYHEANCACFADPTMAHSELFGHVAGAYTGSVGEREGLFSRANGGTLFLDEFQVLDKGIRGRLLTALQTDDDDGTYTFTPLGGNEPRTSKFQLILGSNVPLDTLRADFPADFWDRIHQRVVVMPPFDKRKELEAGWIKVWDNMAFDAATDPLKIKDLRDRFLAWLKTLDFPGNFRDLERIAILTADLQLAEDLLTPIAEETDPHPLWFAHLRHKWQDEVRSAAWAEVKREEAAKPASTRALPASPTCAGTTATIDLDFLGDETLTHELALDRLKLQVAKALMRDYESNMALAARTMNKRTKGKKGQEGKFSPTTIKRWLALPVDRSKVANGERR